MHLLISVAGPAEARAALRGGADVIDAKDPRRGALGPVPLHRLAAIRAAVAGARPLSAALGDAASEEALAGAVAAAVAVGVAFVKVALAGGLSGPEFARARALGADVVGVRGAACVGGRMGRVSRARVAALRASAGAASPPTPPTPQPPPRVLAGRGVLPERDVELPEIVRRDDEMLHAVRERA